MLQLKILFSKLYQSFATKQKIMVKGLQSPDDSSDADILSRPISWEGLEKFYSSDKPHGNLRNPENQLLYQKFKVYIKENDIPMQQYIENKILGFDHNPQRPIFYVQKIEVQEKTVQVYAAGHRGHLQKFYLNSETFSLTEGITPHTDFLLLTNNNFPYDLQKGIQHWVVWSSIQLPVAILSHILQGILRTEFEWKIYENTLINKSVPEINHKQLFIRKKQASISKA